MQRNQKLVATAMFLATILTSHFFRGAAHAQAQVPAYKGQFTLPYQVRWGRSVLHPGKYTVTIKSTGSPMIALIRTADGSAVTFVVNRSVSTHTNSESALLLRENNGEFVVHSLSLAELGVVLIYDPSLAHEQVIEAQVRRSVPVIVAKK